MNDKGWIRKHYLPKLKGKVLFVGFSKRGDYQDYGNKINGTFETVDIDKETNPTYVCDYAYEFESKYKYNHISLHGLWGNGFMFVNESLSKEKFGHGRAFDINNKEDVTLLNNIIKDSISKAHSMLEVGGTLQIGPNTNNINILYDYLVDKKLYKEKFRINRDDGSMKHCIFWGEKLSNQDLK